MKEANGGQTERNGVAERIDGDSEEKERRDKYARLNKFNYVQKSGFKQPCGPMPET